MIWWRVDSGFSTRSYTAADVIRHERDELGNTMDIAPEILAQLEHVNGTCLIWACAQEQDARRYGVPEPFDTQHYEVLATDGDGGSLLWIRNYHEHFRRPSPTCAGCTAPQR